TAQTVSSNSTASLTVFATGTALTYQWRKNGSNIANGATGNGSTYAGVTNATLTITSTRPADGATAANGFDVVASGTCTPAATSTRVALTVNTSPLISVQPTAQTVCSNTPPSLPDTSTARRSSDQWRKNGSNIANGATGNGSTYAGVTNATLTITSTRPADAVIAANGFDVVVSGCAPAATSTRVALT